MKRFLDFINENAGPKQLHQIGLNTSQLKLFIDMNRSTHMSTHMSIRLCMQNPMSMINHMEKLET